MSRVRAEALALVNWKGVFYERYALDPHVTALEGNNGAGKTTVMIAAYVVLLPDMTRLRFTNLGETGATGGDKGIWGRLGEVGRPSYAALDFRLPRGGRVLAGVQLERKGEPTVEPSPFLVTGLADDVRLQDLLLLAQGELDVVPELQELRDNAARLGGRLQTFATARDYFAALFEYGITPMRLGTDEERNKLNEMLKTSMTGGMSKGLLQELRSFLLKQEGGLAETLQRMKANLDACRRTRTEVLEAQRLEQEIGSVYEAGEQMFAAAVAATRERAEEMARRVADKEAERDAAVEAARQAQTELEDCQQAVVRATAAKEAAVQAREAATEWERRVAEAVSWKDKLDRRAQELSAATVAHERAKEEHEAAVGVLEQAQAAVSAATDARDRAAAGLADFKAGLEELHRRAAAHKRVVEQLERAGQTLHMPSLEPGDIERCQEQAREELDAGDQKRRVLERAVSDAEAHRVDHAIARGALETIAGRLPEDSGLVEQAHQALDTVNDWKVAARARTERHHLLQQAEAAARRRSVACERARDLGVVWETGTGRASVEQGLESVEETITRAEDRARDQTRAADESERRRQELRDKVQILEAQQVRWQVLIGHAEAVREHLGVPLADRAQLGAARTRIRDAHAQVERALSETEEQQTRLRDEARELRTAGGAFPDALLRLRDDLTADLLASHFEDVGVDEAGELQARLGPLAEALVVEDLDEATRRLAGRDAELPTVWLIQEDSALALDPDRVVGRSGAKDVVVDKGEARRVTRIPARPTLGRAAREQRAALLEKQAEALGARIAELRGQMRQCSRIEARADALLEGVETWLLGDPSDDLERARQGAEAAKDAARAARENALSAKQEATSLRPRQAGLRALLPDAARLDEPDPEPRLRDLRRDLEEATQAARHLTRVERAPALLQRHLDALRRPPLSEADVASSREQILNLRRRRDVLAIGIEALTYVADNRAALDWSDAAPQLAAKEGLVPALTAQHDQARTAVDHARKAEKAAGQRRDASSKVFNKTTVALQMAASRQEEASDRLQQLGVPQPTKALLEQARTDNRAAMDAHKAAERRLGELQKDLGRLEGAFSTASKHADAAQAAVVDEHKQARPAQEAWGKLRPQIEAAGLLEASLSERFRELSGVRGSVNLFPHAQSRRDVLLERLRTAKGATSVLDAVQKGLAESGQSFGESYLAAWLTVRDWLRTRLPAQIAEVDEPLEALDRFRDHLAGLVERLERQETELRGASEDVARGIEVQIRKASGRVRRLNQNLDGVTFGSIHGIRVRMRRVGRMEQVLLALRSGAAQELLFQPGMPVEKALEEIFRRFGGGRTGGQRLLDYREYIHLHVEVQRRSGRAWEPANPTRLSTGEAIGVGAALMMVVLTEWERDANLLRGKRAYGSMRFLFLDEANRLDQANLATVFDLCRNLDLQILVAAPEVARAEGCTVFRLVRTRSESGVEQVIVSGRRVIAGEA